MNNADIIRRRLHQQGLSKSIFKDANDIVSQLGAVQAQDYLGATWALGLRLKDSTAADIDQAFTNGSILRTHLLRPTWHFVTSKDIRWLLKLTAPRVHAAAAYMYRTLELDSTIFKRSLTVLEKTLRGGKYLTRTELTTALKKAGISSDNLLRFTHIMFYAELEGLVCSGPRRGKQFTYALLEERVPPAKELNREESLAELTKRYFSSRGPATLQDFVWWSGLTMTDAKNGIALVKPQFLSEEINGQVYWFSDSKLPAKNKSMTARLLPNYDEYIVGYTDRSHMYDSTHNPKLDARGNFLFQNTILIDGQVIGTWKRTIKKDRVDIELHPFKEMGKQEGQAVNDAIETYGKFLGLAPKII